MRFLQIASILFLIPAIAIADTNNSDYSPLPKKNEILETPIHFDGCSQFIIVEWKSSSYSLENTTNSPQNLVYFNSLCKIALEKYPEFIKKKFGEDVSPEIRVNVSVLPANIAHDGKEFRNLNDMTYRFSSEWKGECCFWGFYSHKLNHLFIRNDVSIGSGSSIQLNDKFKRTFLHEFCHAQIDQSGIKAKFLHNSNEEDEKLVIEYITYLGMNPKTETSK